MYDTYDYEEEQSRIRLIRGREIAEANNMTLSGFKSAISKHLTTSNNEDQWTQDYSMYLESIGRNGYESPIDWGSAFYYDRWR